MLGVLRARGELRQRAATPASAPLYPVVGIPVFERAADAVAAAGVEELVVATEDDSLRDWRPTHGSPVDAAVGTEALRERWRSLSGAVHESVEYRGNVDVERGAKEADRAVVDEPPFLSSGWSTGPNAYVRGRTFIHPDAGVGEDAKRDIGSRPNVGATVAAGANTTPGETPTRDRGVPSPETPGAD